jgi:hypothetical protein
MKTYWGSGDIAPCIPDLNTRWKLVVSFTPRSLYPQGRDKLNKRTAYTGRTLGQKKKLNPLIHQLLTLEATR